MKKMSYSRGFTLVELLVVIAILGILSVGVIVAVNPMGKLAQSRDTVRKNSLGQIKSALESYLIKYGRYPATPGSNWCGAQGSPWGTRCGTDWIPGLVSSGELKVLPQDPSVGKRVSCSRADYTTFIYRSNGTDYKLVAHCGLESNAGKESCTSAKFTAGTQDPFCDPARPTYSWAIWSSNISRNW